MANGIIKYWNGASGWISQLGVSDEPTSESNDLIIMPMNVVSGTPALQAAVTYTIDARQPWLARSITVS